MPRKQENGINPALPLLIIFIILFVAGVYYLAGPPQAGNLKHTYFDQLSFELSVGQTWHVGVPLSQDGNLHLSVSSNSTVLVFVEDGNSYLLNTLVTGAQNFTLPVSTTMGTLDVGVRDNTLGPALIEQFTCFWTS